MAAIRLTGGGLSYLPRAAIDGDGRGGVVAMSCLLDFARVMSSIS